MEQKDILAEGDQSQSKRISYSSFSPHQMIHKQIIPFLHSSTISLLSSKTKNGACRIRWFFKSLMKTKKKIKLLSDKHEVKFFIEGITVEQSHIRLKSWFNDRKEN